MSSDYLLTYADHLDRAPSICAECEEPFWPSRTWQKFCDAVCARLGGVKRVRAARAAARYTGGCS